MYDRSYRLSASGPALVLALLAADVAYAADAQVRVKGVALPEGQSDAQLMEFAVERVGDESSNLVIEYSTQDAPSNPATPGEDYEPIASGTLRLPAGTLADVIKIKVFGDTEIERHERFLVVLDRVTPYSPVPSFATTLAGSTGQFPTSVAIADMDGDGLADLVSADNFGGSISLIRNRSTASGTQFQEAQAIASGEGPRGLAAGDLDGDGRTDLVVPLEYEDRVLIVPNGGALDFSGAHAIDIGGGPYAAAIGDVDGDNRPDVVIAESASSRLAILRNIASGGAVGFESVRHVAVGSFPHSVAIGDFDGDGLGDIAVANSGDNSVSILRSTSSSDALTLDAPNDLPAGVGPEGVAIGDLDGDGKPDLVVANAHTDDVYVFRNLSSGGAISFGPSQAFAAADGPFSVAVADLNGDGKPDIAVSAYGSDAASVLMNRSSDTGLDFDGPAVFPAGDGPYAVAAGDLDGNGSPDLAIANAEAATLSVLSNSPNHTASFSDNDATGTIRDDDDNKPNQFRFGDRAGRTTNTPITSNAPMITGLSIPAPVSVRGGSYSIGCTGKFTTSPGTISNRQRVCVRHVTAKRPGRSVHTTLTVGGVSDTFTSTTKK